MAYRPDSDTAVAVEPTRPAAGTRKYFTNGDPGLGVPATIVDDWILNMIVKEIEAVATIHGDSPDKNNDAQMADAVAGVKAIESHATDTGVESTTENRALVATTQGRATGANSLIAASTANGDPLGVRTTGARSLAAAVLGPILVSGDNAAAIAAKDGGGGGVSVVGDSAAVLGVEDSVAQSDRCVVVASHLCDAGASGKTDAAVVASYNSQATETRSFVAGCTGTLVDGVRAAAIACENADVSGDEAIALASSDAEVSVVNAAVIASGVSGDPPVNSKARSIVAGCARVQLSTGTGAGQSALFASERCELVDDNSLAVGYHATTTPTYSGSNQNLTFRVDGTTGNVYVKSGAAYNTSGADYAEIFANEKEGTLPAGRMVTLFGGGVRLAKEGDNVLGVVSAAPGVLGDTAAFEWSGRWLTDVYGRPVLHEVPMIEWDPVVDRRVERTTIREAYDGPSEGVDLVEGATLYTREVVDRVGFSGLLTVAEKRFGEIPSDATRSSTRITTRKSYNGPVGSAPFSPPPDADYYEKPIPTAARRRTLFGKAGAFTRGGSLTFVRWTAKTEEVQIVEWSTSVKRVEHVRWPKLVRVEVKKTIKIPGYSGPQKDAPPVPEGVSARTWITWAQKEHPDYDPTRTYVPRSSRPEEYTPVGLLGKLPLDTGERVAVGDYLKPGEYGIAVKSANPTAIQVIEILRPFSEDANGVVRALVMPR